MSRCKHRNVVITEIFEAWSGWSFENGILGEDWEGNGAPGFTVKAQCSDCGLDRQYKTRSAPKWVTGLIKAIADRSPIRASLTPADSKGELGEVGE